MRALCIHGLGISGAYFKPLASRLPDLEVVAPDLPGFGANRQPLCMPSMANFAAYLEENFCVERQVLIGHSMGSQIALHLLKRNPGRYAGAVLLSPTVNRFERSHTQQLRRFTQDGFRESLPVLGTVMRDYLRATPSYIWKCFTNSLDDQPEEINPSQPVLILSGSRDLLVPAKWTNELLKKSDAQRQEITGAPHAVHVTHTEEVAAQIRNFVDAL